MMKKKVVDWAREEKKDDGGMMAIRRSDLRALAHISSKSRSLLRPSFSRHQFLFNHEKEKEDKMIRNFFKKFILSFSFSLKKRNYGALS